MGQSKDRYRTALEQISAIAAQATGSTEAGTRNGAASDAPFHGCRLRSLPARLHESAAETARRINPVNAPRLGPMLITPGTLKAAELAVDTGRYWGPQARTLTVSYMESTPAALRARILTHLNAWAIAVSFVETAGTGQVRISRGPGGYYSYLGTDVLHIPPGYQTMNLEGFTMNTSEAEFHRVVRHEVGHTLGFPHEHMRTELVARIDPAKAYPFFLAWQGWDRQTVDEQVLTPLDDASLLGTPPDEDSIMCYQLPGEITYDGQPIRGGTDINATDAAFARSIYPLPGPALPAPVEAVAPGDTEDWPASEDVLVTV